MEEKKKAVGLFLCCARAANVGSSRNLAADVVGRQVREGAKDAPVVKMPSASDVLALCLCSVQVRPGVRSGLEDCFVDFPGGGGTVFRQYAIHRDAHGRYWTIHTFERFLYALSTSCYQQQCATMQELLC